jgi:DNA-directed RNA polymerase specialized sigma24 family protein
MVDDEPEEAKLAFFELVERHRLELLRYCSTMCNTECSSNKNQVIFDVADAKDIVWNAFYQIKKYPEKFDLSKANTSNVERAVEAYLKGIVRTEFKKKYFGTEKVAIEYNYEIDTSADGVLIPTRNVLTSMTKEVEQALLGLTIKEREIFLAYAEFCPNDEYIPRPISSLLQEKLNVAESTLRVYKKRAKQKIIKRLEILNG